MTARGVFRSWDDYFLPGTAVLRNKFTGPGKPYGEADPDMLRVLEETAAELRMGELAEAPITGVFDYGHMKAIHRYVFQDVYEWAGQERVGPSGRMTKDGHAFYPAGPALTAAAEAIYAQLARDNWLRGLTLDEFAARLAETWGELNVVHSFREGNTRAQFVFFSGLAAGAGYRLDAERFRPGGPLRQEFVQARYHSQDTGSNDRFADVLRRGVAPLV